MALHPASPTPAGAAAASLRWQLLPTISAEGAWQMACDSWLLERAVAGCREPVLRFYRWSRPTLSLGFHQHHLEPHWQGLREAGRIALVRRPSGGRAVLHAGSLTYALIWPQAPANRLEAYQRACGWLQAAFAELDLPLCFGSGHIRRPAAGGGLPASCFALGSAADLCHSNGAKRIGSAQLRRRGQLLQHGSILVHPPAELWRALFEADPPALPQLPWQASDTNTVLDALEQHLIGAAVRHLPAAFGAAAGSPSAPQQLTLSAAEREAIAVLRRQEFSSPGG